MTANVASVAARFLEIGQAADVEISNLKLQKLVALTQSLSEYALAKKAFEEPVQAWKNGPVVKPLYGRYKHHKSGPITSIDRSGTVAVSDSVETMIGEVWDVAGNLPAGALWKLTHECGPWPAIYVDGVENIEIPAVELGRAWPEYLACATKLTAYRRPATTEVVGHGQEGYESREHYDELIQRFRPSRVGVGGHAG